MYQWDIYIYTEAVLCQVSLVQCDCQVGLQLTVGIEEFSEEVLMFAVILATSV